MKTNKFLAILLLLVTTLILTVGCEKSSSVDEENDVAQIMQQKILGYWNLTEFIEETKTGNEPPVIINNDPQNVYFEFFANGKGKTNAEGEEEFSYEVKANNVLILWDNEQKIIELTDHKLTFKNTATQGNTTYTQTYFLTR
ncbi:lipocalin family protein [Chryseobacterium tongliaoense]|uniref:lipocalin family protein n=1 Tax=Chryseobacterium tongliaoense TaxID=3240933 RepID=UPI0035142B9E